MERKILIEPAEAAARGLPPARIAVDLEGLAFLPWKFPDERTYLSLSGPPGGPLFLSIHPLPADLRDADGLEALVEKRNGSQPGFRPGPRGSVTFRKTACMAQLFFTGSSHAATAACALAVQEPRLLLFLGRGGTPENTPDCRAIVESAPLAEVLSRLILG